MLCITTAYNYVAAGVLNSYNKLSFCVGQSSLTCANIYLAELFAGTSPPTNFRRVAVADVAGTTILPVPPFQRIIISFTSTMATENSSKHSLLR